MKKYCGTRNATGELFVNVRTDHGVIYPLDPRFDLRNHSPSGFECGYCGSGPAQLAIALCADALQNDDLAERSYQRVKEKFIAQLPRDTDWVFEEATLLAWISSQEQC